MVLFYFFYRQVIAALIAFTSGYIGYYVCKIFLVCKFQMFQIFKSRHSSYMYCIQYRFYMLLWHWCHLAALCPHNKMGQSWLPSLNVFSASTLVFPGASYNNFMWFIVYICLAITRYALIVLLLHFVRS